MSKAMSEMGQTWVGRVVNGRFPLETYVGGSDRTAVFLTTRQDSSGSEKAAIKLLACDPTNAGRTNAERQLLRWQTSRELIHPNLIRVFEAGRCQLEGTELLYVVEEYAEENLSQILPERALTPQETRGMLPPVLRALQFLHGKGFVHGHVRPSNILAIADQVKLSSDALGVPGEWNRSASATAYDPPESAAGTVSTPTDVWQLGMTLTEVLTQHLPVWDRAQRNAPEIPAAVPEPFREIARHSLQIDAASRWTIARIIDHLEDRTEDRPEPDRAAAAPALTQTAPVRPERISSPAAIPTRRTIAAKWPYLLLLAAAVAIAFVLIPRAKPPGFKVETQPPQSQPGAGAATESSHSAPTPTQPKPSPAPEGRKAEGMATASSREARASGNADLASAGTESDVVKQVMPEVLPSARRTIRGVVKVRVIVDVDAAGDVTEAKLDSAPSSKYFDRVALDAAKQWKFSRAASGEQPGDGQWKIQFAFSHARTDVSAKHVKR